MAELDGGAISGGRRVLIRGRHPQQGKRGVVVGERETGVLIVRLDAGHTTEVRPSLVEDDPYVGSKHTVRCANKRTMAHVTHKLMVADAFPFAVTGPLSAGTFLVDVPSAEWVERLSELPGVVDEDE